MQGCVRAVKVETFRHLHAEDKTPETADTEGLGEANFKLLP
jgi:hypothetical protein